MSDLIEFEDMQKGDVVEFVGFRKGHKHWRFEVGERYSVGYDHEGDFGPINDDGYAPPKNYDNTFMFKLVSRKGEKTMFTEADLKSGMIVEFRNGEKGVVIGDSIVNHNWHCQVNLGKSVDQFNDKAGRTSYGYVIDKVYAEPKFAKRWYDDAVEIDDAPELLWSRESQEERDRREKIEEIERKQRELADELAQLKDS